MARKLSRIARRIIWIAAAVCFTVSGASAQSDVRVSSTAKQVVNPFAAKRGAQAQSEPERPITVPPAETTGPKAYQNPFARANASPRFLMPRLQPGPLSRWHRAAEPPVTQADPRPVHAVMQDTETNILQPETAGEQIDLSGPLAEHEQRTALFAVPSPNQLMDASMPPDPARFGAQLAQPAWLVPHESQPAVAPEEIAESFEQQRAVAQAPLDPFEASEVEEVVVSDDAPVSLPPEQVAVKPVPATPAEQTAPEHEVEVPQPELVAPKVVAPKMVAAKTAEPELVELKVQETAPIEPAIAEPAIAGPTILEPVFPQEAPPVMNLPVTTQPQSDRTTTTLSQPRLAEPVVVAPAQIQPTRSAPPAPPAPPTAEELYSQAEQAAADAASTNELAAVVQLCQRGLASRPNAELKIALRSLAAWACNRSGEIDSDRRREDEALKAFELAIQWDPNCWLALHNRAVSRAQQGDLTGALNDFNRCLQLNPGLAVAYRNRGELLAATGRTEEAVADYTTALVQMPQDADLYAMRGEARHRLGQYDEAIADLSLAIENGPHNAVAYAQRGNVSAELGDFAGAITDFRQALAIDSESAESHRSLAWLLATCPDHQFRNPRLALSSAERAAQLAGPGDPFVLDALAAAHANAGQFDRAVRCQHEAILNVPGDFAEPFRERLALYEQHRPFRNGADSIVDENVRAASLEAAPQSPRQR